MAKPTEEPQPPDWVWKALPTQAYRDTLSASVHFSLKGLNTNAKALGVRLGVNEARDLPYVCLSKALSDGNDIPLDYAENSPQQTATVLKQVANVLQWERAAPHSDAPEAECQTIKAVFAEKAQTHHVESSDEDPISPRARQVLFPTTEGEYVTLIPLPSAVFAGFLQKRWFDYRDRHTPDDKDQSLRPRIGQAYLGFGGSNPQNAGRSIRALQNPFVFSAPQENPRVRRALAIHYKGASMRLPPVPMTAYREWREREKAKGGITSNLRNRRQEARLVADIVHALLRRGQRTQVILNENRAVLDVDEENARLVAGDVEPVAAGLADRGSRTAAWPRQFAEATAHHIVNYVFRDGRTLGLAESAIRELAHWIEEEVRHYEPV